MRKLLILLAVLVTTLAALTGLAAGPAAAAVSAPTCLVINGGSGGTFTKTMVCAELTTSGTNRTAVGHYTPPDATTPHWMTVSVEYLPQASRSAWVMLDSITRSGTGTLDASTASVVPPGAGTVQACTRSGLDAANPNPNVQMCVTGD